MKKCGNCTHFLKIKGWWIWRNGLCKLFDYNVHSDCSVEGDFYIEIQGHQRCKGYSPLKYSRRKP